MVHGKETIRMLHAETMVDVKDEGIKDTCDGADDVTTEPEGEKAISSESTSAISSSSSKPPSYQYSQYLRDKLMEINPHKIPCAFNEILEDNACQTLLKISDENNFISPITSSKKRGIKKGGKKSTTSETDMTLQLHSKHNENLCSDDDISISWMNISGSTSPDISIDSNRIRYHKNQNVSESELKTCISLDHDGVTHLVGTRSHDGTCMPLADDNSTDCAPNVKRARAVSAWVEGADDIPEAKVEHQLLMDLIYERTRLSLSSSADNEVSGWYVCRKCMPCVRNQHNAGATLRPTTSSKVRANATKSAPTAKRSGSSENINTIAKFLSWRPRESVVASRARAALRRSTPQPAAPPPATACNIAPCPHKQEIKYNFLHNKSHRSYMRSYRREYTDNNMFSSLGISLANLTPTVPTLPSKIQISCQSYKDCSTLKLSQFHFKVTSKLRTSNQITPKVKSGNSIDSASTPSPIQSPIVVCRSRPSIPSNARGVVCPTSVETPTHIVTTRREAQ